MNRKNGFACYQAVYFVVINLETVVVILGIRNKVLWVCYDINRHLILQIKYCKFNNFFTKYIFKCM